MDPLFGLPVVKESSAMDTARTRNRSHEKLLSRRISKIEEQCRSKTSKINMVTKDLEITFKDRNPSSDRSVVLPRGMSKLQKDKYLHIRRQSLPSMSLEQFDDRLKELKKRRDSTRNINEMVNFQNASTTAENIIAKGKASIGPDFSEIDQEITCIVPESPTNLNRWRYSQQREVLKRADNDAGLKSPRLTKLSRFPPIADVVNAKERLRPLSKQSFGNTCTLSPTGAMPNLKTFGNFNRRATMPEIHGFLCPDSKLSSNQNPDLALAKIDDIVDTWCSSPAVKLQENEGKCDEKSMYIEDQS